jgi:signal transduction histidine kinase/ActR/RegA family two-component response regulator
MVTSGYAAVAAVRHRELPTRVGLALFIGAAAMLMAPSVWPVIWFCAVLAGQAFDWLAFRPLRLAPDRAAGWVRALCIASAALNTAIYSAISIYLWTRGGEFGPLFALVQVAGGLLHVSLHMHHVRGLLFASVIPHAAYFLGLPILTLVVTRNPAVLAVVLAAFLYVTHLVVAVRQSINTTRELRKAELEAVKHRNLAESASAAKSEFLAVISHEIRTPMNAVISAANLLRRTRLDVQQREHVAMLLDGGDMLLGLLNDVLDFSKIEAGKMRLESAEMNVRNKLGALRRLWEPKAASRGVRLSVVVDETVPETVLTDPLRFQQILFNLLSNAVKFTKDGAIRVDVGWDPAASTLTAEVHDTGCGIPADQIDSIFDSFEQVSAGDTRRYGGTGLGLAISRRLAQAMGGDLGVSSAPGEGSTFTLKVQVEVIDEAVAKAAPAARPAPVSLQGRSILAVDDHEVNRRILSLLLEPHGCRLTLVENGAEAVEAAGIETFDAILMDMQMPVMDGLEATRRIRMGGGPNAGTPIIALTANAMDVHRAAWDTAGVHAFLTKPIDAALLARTLGEACAERGRERGADAYQAA